MADNKGQKQKSKYQLRIRNGRKGRQKKFNSGGSRAWLKMRHRMRKKMLR